MKTLRIAVALLFVGAVVNAATNQARSLGYVRVQISSAPISLIDQTVPYGAFELIACTDCVQSALCISSGTGTGAYVVTASSHSLGSLASRVHCR